jgi:hypothetical protein
MPDGFMNPNGFQETFDTLSVAKGHITIGGLAAGHGNRGGGIFQRCVGRARVMLLLQKRD